MAKSEAQHREELRQEKADRFRASRAEVRRQQDQAKIDARKSK